MIIITVNFNRPEFLSVQLPLIQRNLQPEAIHVINTGMRNNGCKDIAKQYDAKYMYIDTGGDYSQSHALALNVGYAANRQLTALQNLCSELVKRKCEPIIVDNGSTYKPLLKWLSTCEYPVHRLSGEADHLSPWKFGFVRHHAAGKPYIVTDNDLDISGVPLHPAPHCRLWQYPFLNLYPPQILILDCTFSSGNAGLNNPL